MTRLWFFAVLMKFSRRLNDIAGFCLAAMLLFAYAPLIGFVALAIYIDGAGPVLLTRTLKVDGRPDVRSFVFRPTPFGTFLRKSSLDRLPLLLSILWGGMPLGARATPHEPAVPL